MNGLIGRAVARAGLASAFALVPLGLAPVAQTFCTEDAMIVFDGSGSMAEIGFNQIGTPRISEAREALHEAIPPIAEARRLGLVIYGPGGDGICSNIDLRFSPQWQAAPRILEDVDRLRPVGGTPLTESVRRAAEALDYLHQPGAVVLVTDGDETCGGTPCQLAAEFAHDAPGLTVHVIGFKVRGKHFGWESEGANDYNQAVSVARCLADATGGQYLSAETVGELVAALRVTLGCDVYSALDPAQAALPQARAVPERLARGE